MSWWSVWLVGATACGRIAFDPSTLRDDASEGAASCAAETCNGIDDDCNGLIDEACPCTPFEALVSSPLGIGPTWPLVWTGAGYLVEDASGGFARAYDAAGTRTPGSDIPLSNTNPVAVFWDGAALVRADRGGADEVRLSHVAATGVTTTFATIPTPGAIEFELARDTRGRGYTLMWSAGTTSAATILAITLDASGNPLAVAETLATGVNFPGALHAVWARSPLASWSTTDLTVRGFSTSSATTTITGQHDGQLQATTDGALLLSRASAWRLTPLDGDGNVTGDPTDLDASLTGRPATLATHGRGWIAAFLVGSSTKFDVQQVEIDTAGSVTASPTTVFSAPGSGNFVAGNFAMWADAERTAISFVYSDNGVTMQQLVVRCP